MATRLWSVVFDANDPQRLAAFWSDALGWRLKQEVGYFSVTRGEGFLPRVEFADVPEPKTSKNRIHLDLASESPDDQMALVKRLEGAGATPIDIGQPKDAKHVVLADPEGNEFCVVAPRANYSADRYGVGPIAAIAHDQADASLGRFWASAIGWEIVWDHDDYVGMRDARYGPLITFGPPVAPKAPKNRVHFDIAPEAADDWGAQVERLVAMGARRIDIGQGDAPWIVLADPEGNEFCVLTPR